MQKVGKRYIWPRRRKLQDKKKETSSYNSYMWDKEREIKTGCENIAVSFCVGYVGLYE